MRLNAGDGQIYFECGGRSALFVSLCLILVCLFVCLFVCMCGTLRCRCWGAMKMMWGTTKCKKRKCGGRSSFRCKSLCLCLILVCLFVCLHVCMLTCCVFVYMHCNVCVLFKCIVGNDEKCGGRTRDKCKFGCGGRAFRMCM